MTPIGIVGAGIAGLHLGLFLQQHSVPVTIYTQLSPDQQRAARITNVVVRSAPTREREQRLGVDHWDTPETVLTGMSVFVRGQRPFAIQGNLDRPLSVVDMRLYCATLLEDFMARGGRVVTGMIRVEDVERLAEQHELVVIAAGRKHLTALFPRVPKHSPFEQPQRLVCAGLYRGIACSKPRSLEVVVTPGHGEFFVTPMISFEPELTVFAVEVVPGGAFEALRGLRYAEDPRRFNTTMLDLLHEYAPMIAERVTPGEFAIARPLDQMYTAITPTVRQAYTRLPNRKLVVAVGDVHVVNDPLTGQGANTASHAAWIMGEAILDSSRFDEAFCRDVEQRMWSYTSQITAACNARLVPPPPHIIQLMGAAAQHKPLAEAYVSGFNAPDRFWQITSSSERTAAWLHEFGLQSAPELVAA